MRQRILGRQTDGLAGSVLALSLALAGCGGGASEAPDAVDTVAAETLPPVAVQVNFGAYTDGSLLAYAIDDLDTPLAVATRNGSAPFELPGEALADNQLYLLVTEDGELQNADHDGEADGIPQAKRRPLHLLATGADLRAAPAQLSAYTEALYQRSRYLLAAAYPASSILAELDARAAALLAEDLNQDGQIDRLDLTHAQPEADQLQIGAARLREEWLHTLSSDADPSDLAFQMSSGWRATSTWKSEPTIHRVIRNPADTTGAVLGINTGNKPALYYAEVSAGEFLNWLDVDGVDPEGLRSAHFDGGHLVTLHDTPGSGAGERQLRRYRWSAGHTALLLETRPLDFQAEHVRVDGNRVYLLAQDTLWRYLDGDLVGPSTGDSPWLTSTGSAIGDDIFLATTWTGLAVFTLDEGAVEYVNEFPSTFGEVQDILVEHDRMIVAAAHGVQVFALPFDPHSTPQPQSAAAVPATQLQALGNHRYAVGEHVVTIAPDGSPQVQNMNALDLPIARAIWHPQQVEFKHQAYPDPITHSIAATELPVPEHALELYQSDSLIEDLYRTGETLYLGTRDGLRVLHADPIVQQLSEQSAVRVGVHDSSIVLRPCGRFILRARLGQKLVDNLWLHARTDPSTFVRSSSQTNFAPFLYWANGAFCFDGYLHVYGGAVGNGHAEGRIFSWEVLPDGHLNSAGSSGGYLLSTLGSVVGNWLFKPSTYGLDIYSLDRPSSPHWASEVTYPSLNRFDTEAYEFSHQGLAGFLTSSSGQLLRLDLANEPENPEQIGTALQFDAHNLRYTPVSASQGYAAADGVWFVDFEQAEQTTRLQLNGDADQLLTIGDWILVRSGARLLGVRTVTRSVP